MTRNFAGFASLREPSFFPRYRIGKDEVSPKGAKEETAGQCLLFIDLRTLT